MRKLKLLTFVPAIAVLWLSLMIANTPKDTLVGGSRDEDSNSAASPHVSMDFQSNGRETQQLMTVRGLLIAKGSYTWAGITIDLPIPIQNQSYRCKVAGNVLELDSHALAEDVPGENYLPLEGEQISLLRNVKN